MFFLVKVFVQQQNIGWKFEVSWFSSNSNTVIQQKLFSKFAFFESTPRLETLNTKLNLKKWKI